MLETTASPTVAPQPFIERWRASGAAEQANSQSFLGELCDLLEVPRPEPTRQDDAANVYVFEKVVEIQNGDGTSKLGRIDLYRQGAFVLESKQGSERRAAEDEAALSNVVRGGRKKTGTAPRGTKAWDQAMTRARNQAKRYAEALPDEWPPLLIVCDVGFCLDLYADFARTGKNYAPFPDPQSFRLRLEQLADPVIRERLRLAWLDPLSLDPARRSAKVTRDLAAKLAELAKRLERRTSEPSRSEPRPSGSVNAAPVASQTLPDGRGSEKAHTPDAVAQFLMRCLFTIFAEDVNLLPKSSFHDLLTSLRDTPENFAPMAESLWATMETGGFSPILRQKLLRFNGGLFEDRSALPLDRDQLELLIEASEAEWTDVEPAIFGTLLERALDPRERHKLGAHYTPRAYVERLVVPTIMEPLRGEWDDVYAAAVQLDADGKSKDAIALVREYHGRLCEVRILDPACGSGNFLYVALELIKRLEGEVLNALKEFGDNAPPLLTVDPHQFLGIEVNPRAAAIADLVLWIGYLQWHFRTRGRTTPPEPVLHAFHNIENRDAVLAHDGAELVLDEAGNPVTRWDGRTTKPHPVTGEEVPDDTARVPVLRYLNPRKADWPEADYVVGNPPFIGGWRIRQSQGDGYVDALWSVYDDIPPKADYVMFWWDRAADLVCAGRIRRFGFITTNSITQVFQRRVLQRHLEAKPTPARIIFAIPDHPWVDSESAAAVRIAMTVVTPAMDASPKIGAVGVEDDPEASEITYRPVDRINPDLSGGCNLDDARPLRANDGLCSAGVQLYGAGFILSASEAAEMIGAAPSPEARQIIRRYANGRDLMAVPRDAFVIDFFGYDAEQARTIHPLAYQRVLDRVKPERDHNRREAIRSKWWRFGWERPIWRQAVSGLNRFITTPETAKHRVFQFLDAKVTPDNRLTNFASQDAYILGVLSSRIHVAWSLAAGGTLEDRPIYTKTVCFDPFPFPACTESQQSRIRELAEALDAHRKRQQAAHAGLTMTGMYNVLERLREFDRASVGNALRGVPHGPDDVQLAEERPPSGRNAAEGVPYNGLTAKERTIHEQGLVSVLRQLHDDLDAAVAAAYGWPVDLTDEQILERLVALNAERAAEEAKGLVRWLRPAFQNPGGTTATQKMLTTDEPEAATPAKAAKVVKRAWPGPLPERVQAVRSLLHEGRPLSAYELSRRFTRANTNTVTELLDTLVALGQARQLDDGRYAA
ncbi:MAG: DNA methyltransferase [Planctomycetaceae bacterium]